MDCLEPLPDGRYDESFTKPCGDDTYWLGAAWYDKENGMWYAPVHVEYNYRKLEPDRDHDGHVRRIVLGVSSDDGVTWHNRGNIITGDNSDSSVVCYNTYLEKYMAIGVAEKSVSGWPHIPSLFCQMLRWQYSYQIYGGFYEKRGIGT